MQTVTLAGTRIPSAARPENHVIVLFGATGDLARRRLLPGLFRLAAVGLMPDRYQIIGSAGLGQAAHQLRADRRARDTVHRGAGGLLQPHRRLPAPRTGGATRSPSTSPIPVPSAPGFWPKNPAQR